MKILAALCLLLVGTLAWSLHSLHTLRRDVAMRQFRSEQAVMEFSNRWDAARRSLEEQRSLNQELQANLHLRMVQLEALRGDIGSLKSDLAQSMAETQNAREELARIDDRIASLDLRRDDLARRLRERQAAIAEVEAKLADAQALPEADRAGLEESLAKWRGERTLLEQQLEDLAEARAEAARLRDERREAFREEWNPRGAPARAGRRQGLADQAGGDAQDTVSSLAAPSPIPGGASLNRPAGPP